MDKLSFLNTMLFAADELRDTLSKTEDKSREEFGAILKKYDLGDGSESDQNPIVFALRACAANKVESGLLLEAWECYSGANEQAA